MANFLEMNFVRLLHCTEDLAASDHTGEWRFSCYLNALKEFLDELNSSDFCPSRDYIRHYESRLKQLELARELALSKSADERARLLIAQPIPLIPRPIRDASFVLSGAQPATKAIDSNSTGPSRQPDSGDTPLVQGVLDGGPQVVKTERHHQYMKNREQLLGPTTPFQNSVDADDSNTGGSRKTKRAAKSQLLHQEELRREELASEMLGMARELKDRSEAISSRLQSDCTVVETSISQADRNRAELTRAMNQLSEELGSRCACVVWLALLIAVILFAQMIAFMKLFRKRTGGLPSSMRSDL